jgi:CheY-like chemotaxis protein
VEDNGVGIPGPMLSQIFEMFTQVDRSLEKSQGGLGVGLTIVKRLVEMHGGSVSAHSAGPDTGSRFTVRLPVARTEAATTSASPVSNSAGRPQNRRILVVDDNHDSALTLAMLLKIMGHETQTAHDGVEAVSTAEQFRPELIIMDIGMPRMNGLDACRRIREQPWGKTITMVALTGWGQEQDQQRTREAGFDLHLVKPVQPAELNEVLGAASALADKKQQ